MFWSVELLGRSPGRGHGNPLQYLGFPSGSDGKEPVCNAGDLGSIPGLERSPGEGNGKPLQYCCLENPMDRGVWQAAVHKVTQSWTRLKRLSTHIDWEAYKQQKCVSHNTGGCKSTIRASAWSGEGPLLVCKWMSYCVLPAQRVQGSRLPCVLHKRTDPVHEASTLVIQTSPKGPTS